MAQFERSEAEKRLRAVGARYQADVSTSQRYIYWSSRTKKYYVVKGLGYGMVSMVVTDTCPCAKGS